MPPPTASSILSYLRTTLDLGLPVDRPFLEHLSQALSDSAEGEEAGGVADPPVDGTGYHTVAVTWPVPDHITGTKNLAQVLADLSAYRKERSDPRTADEWWAVKVYHMACTAAGTTLKSNRVGPLRTCDLVVAADVVADIKARAVAHGLKIVGEDVRQPDSRYVSFQVSW